MVDFDLYYNEWKNGSNSIIRFSKFKECKIGEYDNNTIIGFCERCKSIYNMHIIGKPKVIAPFDYYCTKCDPGKTGVKTVHYMMAGDIVSMIQDNIAILH